MTESTDLTGAEAIARLMRFDDGRWTPVGDPLPPFQHAPPDQNLVVAPWVLPCELAAITGDVLVVGEVAHQLLTRCARDDPVYVELAEQTMLFHSYDDTMAWLALVEVWVGRRLEPGRPWPIRVPS